jgi:hypothetical protein
MGKKNKKVWVILRYFRNNGGPLEPTVLLVSTKNLWQEFEDIVARDRKRNEIKKFERQVSGSVGYSLSEIELNKTY